MKKFRLMEGDKRRIFNLEKSLYSLKDRLDIQKQISDLASRISNIEKKIK